MLIIDQNFLLLHFS